jgi:hypothetical protein
MTTTKFYRLLFIIAAAVIMLLGVSAFGWQVNQHYVNNTGQTAYDLTKILLGQHTFTEVMLNQPFTNFEDTVWGGFTLGHWYNGTVAPGQYGHACFSTNSNPAPAFAALWTDANDSIIGYAGPVAKVGIEWHEATGTLKFLIDNEWRQWTGSKYPPVTGDTLGPLISQVTISGAAYAMIEDSLPLAQLDSAGFFANPTTDIPEMDVLLTKGTEVTHAVDIGKWPEYYKTVLFYFRLDGDGKHSYYVVQRRLDKPVATPSLTNLGLAILVALLIITAIYVVYQRRRVAAHRL